MSSEGTTDTNAPPRKIALRLGGVLTVILGLIALQNGFIAITAEEENTYGADITPGDICGTTIIFFGIMAIAGGVCALMARNFSMALAGALLGMAGGGWASFFIGVLAFALFLTSSEDL
jgi:hypothetical protein